MLEVIGFLIDFFEDIQQHSVDFDPLGLGFEIEQYSMP
jgi:hypothetical protein